MRRSARIPLLWGIALILLGAVLVEFLPEVLWSIGEVIAWGDALVARVISIALIVVQSVLFPLGAVLIGSAVVIESILRALDHQLEAPHIGESE